MSRTLSALVARTTRAVGPVREVTDGELLRQFARTRDESAFAELVHRLGPLVLGACRRVVPDQHAAEDAFQAAFVVLARRASEVRPAEAVRGWLYGVAVRCAKEARTVNARRHRRETSVATVPDRASEPTAPADPDALATLDEEIAKLPEHLRAAVVLCELDGLGRKEAAARLGIAEGTLSSRLAKARKLLAERLRARGVALSTAGLTALGHAAVSPELLARASAPSAPVPQSVAELIRKASRTVLFTRLKTAALGAVCVAALGWAAVAAQPGESKPFVPALALARAAPPELAPAPRVRLKGPNRILIGRESTGQFTLDPDGKNEKPIRDKGSTLNVIGAKLSPDGTRFAAQIYGKVKPGDDPDRGYLYVRGLNEREPGTDLGASPDCFVWSRDGTELACSEFEDAGDKPPFESTHYIVNVKTKEKTALKLPSGHAVTDWSADTQLFFTRHRGEKPKPFARLYLMNRDGSEHKALTGAKEYVPHGRLSPDGTRVLYAVQTSPPETPMRTRQHDLVVLDVATGKGTKVRDVPLNIQLLEFCWSPDGKQIAYLWRTLAEGDETVEDVLGKETETHLIVCSPDGTNQKTILSEKGTGIGVALSGLDWR